MNIKSTKWFPPGIFFTLIMISFNGFTDDKYHLSEIDRSTLQLLIESDQRTEKLRARNRYRHPLQTLDFFEVHSDLAVIEIWPGGQGGWYRSILAPYLSQKGNYIPLLSGSNFPAQTPDVKEGMADRILVFRAHGFMIYKHPAQAYFDRIYTMLKPGGIFGIVDHRGDEAVDQDPQGKNGYVNQSHVLKLASKAGFELIAESQINANPYDTKDYPDGLYSLPPTLKSSFLNRDLRKKMLSIGESDRMTLKFRKPGSSR